MDHQNDKQVPPLIKWTININRVFIGLTFITVLLVYVSTRLTNLSNLNLTEISNFKSKNVTGHMFQNNVSFKIVFYSPYHRGMRYDFDSASKRMDKCVYNNCVMKIEKRTSKTPINADAVLFQGGNMPSKLPKRRDSNQAFVFFNTESPVYLNYLDLKKSKWVNFYNWTMTYRYDSDIPYQYGVIVPKDSPLDDTPTPLNYDRSTTNLESKTYLRSENVQGITGKNYSAIFNRKSKSVAWLVSHCTTASKREQYVKKMEPVIDTDIYGRCSGRVCPKGTECEKMIIGNYKFYLSFENSLCIDYITEKVFSWYNRDIIIVVLGAPENARHLPRGTYIDANDFSGPRELAKYLTKLANDEEQYLNILKRKDQFKVINRKYIMQSAFCKLCKRLNNLDTYRSSIANIHSWWKQGKCV